MIDFSFKKYLLQRLFDSAWAPTSSCRAILAELLGVLGRNFVWRKYRETGWETILVFRDNKGQFSQVSQFREIVEVTKETNFAKHEIGENHDNVN